MFDSSLRARFLNFVIAIHVPAILASCGGSSSPDAPEVTTLLATDITTTSARLNLRVDPNRESTEATFYWGGDASLFNDYSADFGDVGGGKRPVDVSVQLTGLAPDTNYYFKARASNVHGLKDEGQIRSFRTLEENSSYWARSYGTEGGNDTLRAVAFTSDGGYALAGRVASSIGTELWIIKLDADNSIEWQKTYAAIGFFEAYDIIETSDGNLLVAGSSPDPDFDTNQLEPYPWLLKIDLQGGVIWEKRYSQFGFFKALFETPDMGAILFADTIFDLPGGIELDLGIYKLDQNGEVDWFKRVDTGLPDFVRSAKPTAGGYAIAGESRVFPDLSGSVGYVPWAFEIDSTGNILWQQQYACEFRPEELQVLNSGDLIIAGNNDEGGALLQLDSDGDYRWMKIYSDDDFQSIDIGSTGDIYATGCFDTGSGCGIGIARLDPLGNQVWAKDYHFIRRDGKPSDGSTRKIREKSNGDLLFLGRYEVRHDEMDAQIMLLPPGGDLAGIDADHTLDDSFELCLETGSTPLTSGNATESTNNINTFTQPSPVTAFQQASM